MEKDSCLITQMLKQHVGVEPHLEFKNRGLIMLIKVSNKTTG